MNVENIRIDILLYKKGMAKSRSSAVRLIEDGKVYANGKLVQKPSESYSEDTELTVTENERYVSRGGLKLEYALQRFNVDPAGMKCLDVGASTGGFTDCLLKHGAAFVCAVDCGHDQLDSRLLEDDRVMSLEGVNARRLSYDIVKLYPDLVVMDVSFISQTLIYPSLSVLMPENGLLISLIKPQFEAGKKALSKKGIVTDEKIRLACVQSVIDNAKLHGLVLVDKAESAIKGGDGNVEYIALFKRQRSIS